MRSKLINKSVRTPLRAALLAGATVLALAAGSGAARASITADGITYTLTESGTANPLVDNFVLGISGINDVLNDTEGGRSGVVGLAFNQPTNYSTATPPSGFNLVAGGLNSGGCSMGSANFYCFAAKTMPLTAPALAADSTLSYAFSVTLTSGSFLGYDPDFKINWIGSNSSFPNGTYHSGYDLVSLALKPSGGNSTSGGPVPEPGSLALLGTGVIGLGFAVRRRRRRT